LAQGPQNLGRFENSLDLLAIMIPGEQKIIVEDTGSIAGSEFFQLHLDLFCCAHCSSILAKLKSVCGDIAD
jgi:hypothetical protein